MAFMRAYAALAGDPSLGMQRLVSKRKQAGAGPRMKAFRKRSVRQLRLVRTGAAAGDPFLGMAPAAAAAVGRALGGAGMVPGAGDWLKKAFGAITGAAKSALPAIGQVLGGGLPALANAKPMAGGLGNTGSLPGLGFVGPLMAPGGAGARAFGGGKRRSMNVANVKALRRGIRRLEGFKKLVKRVDQLLPAAARSHPPRFAKRRGKR